MVEATKHVGLGAYRPMNTMRFVPCCDQYVSSLAFGKQRLEVEL